MPLAAGPALAADAETPVMTLFREWLALDRAVSDACHSESPEFEELDRQLQELDRKLLNTPRQNAQDMLIWLGVFTCFADLEPTEDGWQDFWTEARSLIGT